MAEFQFVKDLAEDYQCLVCAKVLEEPHLTDCCGQHFCRACLEQWFQKKQKKICPHCRSTTFSHMRSLPLKRKIDALEVYCPNKKEGCAEIVKLEALNDHKSGCGFARVLCPQRCGQWILCKDLLQHCRSECSLRMIKCKYCGKEDCYVTITGAHMAVCEEYPVRCPRGCGTQLEIRRKNLAEHAQVCPLETVQCPFSEVGCSITVLRKDLGRHMESSFSIQQHLMQTLTAYSKLRVDHDKLKKELSTSQVASLTLVEPVTLTGEGSTFSFMITSSRGWVSPPFSVREGYTFCIKHKEENTASLMLLKGRSDDMLPWPLKLPYKLEVVFDDLQESRERPSKTKRRHYYSAEVFTGSSTSKLTYDLTVRIERVAVGDNSREIANATLPEDGLLNYEATVKMIRIPPIVELPAFLGSGNLNKDVQEHVLRRPRFYSDDEDSW